MRYLAAALLVLTVSVLGCGERPPTYSPADFDDTTEYEFFDNSDEVQFNATGFITAGTPPDSHIEMKLDFNGWECTFYRYDPAYDMIAICGDPGALSPGSGARIADLVTVYARRGDTAALEALSEFFAAHPIEGADTTP